MMRTRDFQAYRGLSDRQIITLITNQDKLAVAYLLIERCGSRLFFLVNVKFRHLGLEFEDIVNDLFIYLQKNDWKALRDFRGANKSGKICKIENYISLIASRLLLKKMNKIIKDTNWILPLYEAETRQIPDRSTERRQIEDFVVEAIMSLENPGERAVILLYKIEGYSVQEVAEILNISPANVYTRCSRAIKNLRYLLEEGGVHV